MLASTLPSATKLEREFKFAEQTRTEQFKFAGGLEAVIASGSFLVKHELNNANF